MMAYRPFGLLLALALAIPGCGAVRSLNAAAAAQDTYELQPLSGGIAGRAGRSLSVEVPSATAAIATERILIKPNALQVAYLPGVRWVEAAPLHVQSLLIRSVANSGRAGFVGGPAGTGPLPDYLLLTDIEAFQAEVRQGAEPPVEVVVRLTLTLMRDIDGRVVGVRRFERTVGAASDGAPDVVSAFNVAMSGLLQEATGWIVAAMSGAGV
jgi:cholesterol transport system auxiliary component